MAISITSTPLPFPLAGSLPAPVTPVGGVNPAAPIAVALQLAAGAAQDAAQAPGLPESKPLPGNGSAADDPQALLNGPAMRPDQVLAARQLAYPSMSGAALAAGWQSMVRTYGMLASERESQARAARLAPAVLAAAREGHVPRPPDQLGLLADAWRFTVHAGSGRPHVLQVLADEDDDAPRPQRERRRARAALRLELRLADGSVVVVQVEPLLDGLALDLCAPDAAQAEHLRALQPELERVLAGAGLQVLRWGFRDELPAGSIHAALPLQAASSALNLPVFRALAELALLLPGLPLLAD